MLLLGDALGHGAPRLREFGRWWTGHAEYVKGRGDYFPGARTRYDEVRLLTPNTLLDLGTTTVHRFFPREPVGERRQPGRAGQRARRGAPPALPHLLRLGVWHSTLVQLHKPIHRSHVLWNCRRLLTALLARPLEERLNGTVPRALVASLWPAVRD